MDGLDKTIQRYDELWEIQVQVTAVDVLKLRIPRRTLTRANTWRASCWSSR